MKTSWRMFMALCLLTAAAASAQSQPSSTTDGTEVRGYQFQQSIEFGYRFTDVTGSVPMYNTFIDQGQGPRLLEQTLSLRSPEHQGALFDDAFVSSFGWGGDPENVARARVRKFKAYDFSASFRRDHNYFDYNLLANPLNPPTSTPFIPVTSSPHSTYLTRRMYDFGLTILPDSKFTVRLGYWRNRNEGPSFSTNHEGTDVLLFQPWNVTFNGYQFGFDYKGLTRTTISYDQFLTYFKNDTDYFLAPFATFVLPNGAPVEFGLPIDTAGNSPCRNPVTGGVANPVCNGYFNYSRDQRVRSNTPVEQLTLTSNYFRRVNFTGRFTYGSTDLNSPYFEFFDGLVTRTNERQFTFSGPVSVRRLSTTVDAAVTVDLTNSVRLINTFRFDNWRIPGSWDSVSTATVAATTPGTLLSPLGATTTTADFIANFLGMKTYSNLIQVQYTRRRAGFNVGYRFRQRHVFKAEPETVDPEAPFEGFEGDDLTVNEHGPVAGIWFRPTSAFRINVDGEYTTSPDDIITRISPRSRWLLRARGEYKPGRWGTFSASVNTNQGKNNDDAQILLRQHYRNYGFIGTLFPNDRFNLELSYNFTDVRQALFICYNGTFIAPGTVVGGCPTFAAGTNNNPNWLYSDYKTNTHYVFGLVSFTPVTKLTARLGYGLTRNDGNTNLLNVLQPLATLDFTYHQPLAGLSYEFVKNLSVNAYWNYDQYSEGSFTGPTLPRYFHDNRTVLSMRYAF